MKKHNALGRAFVFAGLTAALALGIIGSCYYRRQPGATTTTNPRQISRIEMLDAQARPHFDEARRNIPSVVDQMTGTGALCKLCWLMSRDKITGSHKTQDYLESILNGPIVGPCRAGARVYGYDITSGGFVNGVKAVNSDYAMTGAYALTGLSIEALFLKKTIASLCTVLNKINYPCLSLLPLPEDELNGRVALSMNSVFHAESSFLQISRNVDLLVNKTPFVSLFCLHFSG